MIEDRDIVYFCDFYRNVYRNSHPRVKTHPVDILEEILFYRPYAKYSGIASPGC
jgi:hypothetical protein